VVRLAKHPRRSVILPWYYSLAFFFDRTVPGLVDWFLNLVFVRRFHVNLETQDRQDQA
jgi:hypothetical protein